MRREGREWEIYGWGMIQPALGLNFFLPFTQGRSVPDWQPCLATLGWMTESRWDSLPAKGDGD
jgi:hypothetical protein